MPLVTCESCKSRWKLPDGTEGKRVKCPKCQGVIAVPAAAPPAATPSPSPPPAPAPSPSPAPAPPRPPPPPPAPPPAPPPPPPAGPPTRIAFLSGKLKGQEQPLLGEFTFGRDPACNLVIPDGSLKQAAIKKLPDGWIFRDLGGKNAVPIMINDLRSVEKILRDGDKVRIGPLAFQFVQGVDPAAVAPKSSGPRPEVAQAAAAAAAARTEPDLAAAAPPPPPPAAVPPSLPYVEALVVPKSTDDSLTALLDLVLEAFPGADRAFLCGLDPAKGALEHRPLAARAAGGAALSEMPGQAVLEKVAAKRAPYATTAGGGQAVFDLLASTTTQAQAVICAPVTHRGRFLGALYLDSRQNASAFRAGDAERLASMAMLAGLALNELRLESSIARFQSRIEMFSHYMDLGLLERLESAGRAVQTRGEMKKLTVLFTDIRNFTSLSEKIEPQKLITMMNQYFDAMVDGINRYDGYVNKFIGDSIMAFWGAPDARSIDSLQAVRAAMLMQRNLYFLNQDRERDGQPPLYMGVGLHTGNAVVGNVGAAERKEYSALGDTVNTASRIQSLTKLELPIYELNYRIFLSEATYAEVREQIKAEPLPPQKVKGKAEAVNVFSVQGVTQMCEEEGKRRGQAAEYTGEVTALLPDESRTWQGRGTALSRVGLVASFAAALPPNAEVVLHFELEKGQRLEEIRGRATRMEAVQGGVSVELRFDPLPSRKLRRLEDFLGALEKKPA